MGKKVQALYHVPFEKLGNIQSWLRLNNCDLHETEMYADHDFLNQPDLLIIMGGPMSIHDTCEYPWLEIEKTYIRTQLDRDIPVLGICLGAQLLAEALGSTVSKQAAKEIGWFPVEFDTAVKSNWNFPANAYVFHWHGESFNLPQGTDIVGSSSACNCQGFIRNSKQVGLQFHLETSRISLDSLIDASDEYLQSGTYIQSKAEMESGLVKHERLNRSMLFSLLDFISK